jgi:hypothetical protein
MKEAVDVMPEGNVASVMVEGFFSCFVSLCVYREILLV